VLAFTLPRRTCGVAVAVLDVRQDGAVAAVRLT
jgi:hypothetical protein